MREVRLYGALGARFGRVHRLAIASPAEAVRALCANFPDFERAVVDHVPGYRVWSGAQRIADPDDLHGPVGSREVVRIAPVVAGAGGRGFGQILIGAAIIGAAFFTGGASLSFGVMGLTGIATTTMGSVALSIGTSLILGGVAQMLSPSPKTDAGSGERPDNKPSYVFNGAVNTSAQGQPVPVGYGELTVGSAVISAGIAAEDIDP